MRLLTFVLVILLSSTVQSQLWLPFSQLNKILKGLTVSDGHRQDSTENRPKEQNIPEIPKTSIFIPKLPTEEETEFVETTSPLTHFGHNFRKFVTEKINWLPTFRPPPAKKTIEIKPSIEKGEKKLSLSTSRSTIATKPMTTTSTTTIKTITVSQPHPLNSKVILRPRPLVRPIPGGVPVPQTWPAAPKPWRPWRPQPGQPTGLSKPNFIKGPSSPWVQPEVVITKPRPRQPVQRPVQKPPNAVVQKPSSVMVQKPTPIAALPKPQPIWPMPSMPRPRPRPRPQNPAPRRASKTLKTANTCDPGKRCKIHLKSFDTSIPVFQYAYSQSSRLEEPLRTILHKTQEKPIPSPLGWRQTISPEVVQLSMNLMRLYKPNRSLVIGVFTGLGLVGIAKATDPQGMVVALEYPEYLQYWEKIGGVYAIEYDLMRRIQLRAGTSILASLEQLSRSEPHSFDYILLDDPHQDNYLLDYDLCLKLLRTGGLLVINDALMEGEVLAGSTYKTPAGHIMDQLNTKLQTDGRVYTTFLPYGGGTILVIKR